MKQELKGMEMNLLTASTKKKKRTLKHLLYIIKSYLRIEPCAYCGKEEEPEYICYKCFPK